VVYSFWNTKAKRCEMGVLSLYEGMVGAYDMNPFKIPHQDPAFSSFNAKAPVVMQRTFISPRYIKHLSATVTNQGISTKNILAVFDGGQIAMIPRRMLDPRRPNAVPTKVEMEEGLFQYHPHLFLDPRGYVTMNQVFILFIYFSKSILIYYCFRRNCYIYFQSKYLVLHTICVSHHPNICNMVDCFGSGPCVCESSHH
jgi:hypothetical protein